MSMIQSVLIIKWIPSAALPPRPRGIHGGMRIKGIEIFHNNLLVSAECVLLMMNREHDYHLEPLSGQGRQETKN